MKNEKKRFEISEENYTKKIKICTDQHITKANAVTRLKVNAKHCVITSIKNEF